MISGISAKCPGVKILGVAIQEMAAPGIEVIIGMTMDSQFGPVLMFGLGGIWVELLKDVSFRVVPVSKADASEMIKEIKGHKLLTGFRGQPAVDIEALEDLIVKVSQFIQSNPEIQELDLNPVFAYPQGCIAVDARIIVENKGQSDLVEKSKTDSGPLDFLFYPESVAVAGASNNPASRGYDFMQHLINFKYKGKIYPINLKSSEVMGIKAYSNLEGIPDNVDHVIYCIGLENMPAFLDSAKRKM
jgi:acyl-CoA synthetase (NDP forming)